MGTDLDDDEPTEEDLNFIEEDDVDDEDDEYVDEDNEEDDDDGNDDEEDEEDLTTVDKDVMNPAQIIEAPAGRRFSLRERRATVRFVDQYADEIRLLMMADIPSDEEQAAIEDDVDDDVEIVSDDDDYEDGAEEDEEDEEDGEDGEDEEDGANEAVATAEEPPTNSAPAQKRGLLPLNGRTGGAQGGGVNKRHRPGKTSGMQKLNVQACAV
jgi:hypothetical protein